MRHNPVLLFSKAMWKRIRDEKLCEHFTDEELENADKKMVKIITGWVAGIHQSVDMWIDPKFPILK